MANRQGQHIKKITKLPIASEEIKIRYLERLKEGKLTRDENLVSPFCVYFAAYDPKAKEFFVGHHKKSGLWLFNGGHIDPNETSTEALRREIDEEWGIQIDTRRIQPSLLTITEITSNPNGRPCRWRFDIWPMVPVTKTDFQPDQSKLDTEFYTTKWITPTEAKSIITDPATIEAFGQFEKIFAA